MFNGVSIDWKKHVFLYIFKLIFMLNLNFKTSKLTAHHKLIHLSSELLKYKIDYLTV